MKKRRIILGIGSSVAFFGLFLVCLSIFHYGRLRVLPPLLFSVIVENNSNKPISNVQVFCKDSVVKLGTIPQHWRSTALPDFNGECGGVSVTCNDYQGKLLSGGIGVYLEAGYPGEITATVDDYGEFTFKGISNFLLGTSIRSSAKTNSTHLD